MQSTYPGHLTIQRDWIDRRNEKHIVYTIWKRIIIKKGSISLTCQSVQPFERCEVYGEDWRSDRLLQANSQHHQQQQQTAVSSAAHKAGTIRNISPNIETLVTLSRSTIKRNDISSIDVFYIFYFYVYISFFVFVFIFLFFHFVFICSADALGLLSASTRSTLHSTSLYKYDWVNIYRRICSVWLEQRIHKYILYVL